MECDGDLWHTYGKWCNRLRALREKRGLLQREVASRMCDAGVLISRSQYSAIEASRAVVKYTHLLALAKVFKLSPATIITLKNIKEG